MRLHLAGAGSFEGRTLWTGVGGDTRALTRLMADCVLPGADDLDDSDGLRVRRRAHLTVARATSRTRDRWLIDEHVRAHSVYQGPEFRVDHIDLVQSHLGEGRSGGPRYEVVDRFELTGLGGC